MFMKSKIWKFCGVMLLVFMMPDNADAQTVGVTTNALGWAALSPNVGVEVGFARQWSVSVDGLVNPWTWSTGVKAICGLSSPRSVSGQGTISQDMSLESTDSMGNMTGP